MCISRPLSIYVFPGLQGVEELEKDHARPQQNKHNPTFCLQGGLNFMILLMLLFIVVVVQGISNLKQPQFLLLLLLCRVSVTLRKSLCGGIRFKQLQDLRLQVNCLHLFFIFFVLVDL